MARTVSIVTGPILGLQSERFLAQTVEFAAGQGKKIKVFDLLDEIAEIEQASWDNSFERLVFIGELLDGYQYQFDLLRRAAYSAIAAKMERLPQSLDPLIRAPAAIEWRGIQLEFKDHDVIADAIRPDRIVTLINAEHKILAELKTQYGKRGMEVISQSGEATTETVLEWLGACVSRSEDWADWASRVLGRKVQHFVLSTEAPSRRDRSKFIPDVDNLAKVATAKKLPSFYSSYSMTVAGEAEREAINRAVWRLREYGLVVDPGTIEIATDTDPADKSLVFAYTVFRDLRWDVKKVDAVAAFHPYKERPPLSTGMMDELGHAKAFGKDRYIVLPTGGGSPFTAGTLVPKNHLFASENAFFEFIEKKRRPTLKPQFADQVAAFATWKPPTQT
ncbi:MAG TPA: hypothetical protein VN458_07095 [Solirubrobacterales bacterium]|nr:hypothetical protein [Solirubrobacterales bacterium]